MCIRLRAEIESGTNKLRTGEESPGIATDEISQAFRRARTDLHTHPPLNHPPVTATHGQPGSQTEWRGKETFFEASWIGVGR